MPNLAEMMWLETHLVTPQLVAQFSVEINTAQLKSTSKILRHSKCDRAALLPSRLAQTLRRSCETSLETNRQRG